MSEAACAVAEPVVSHVTLKRLPDPPVCAARGSYFVSRTRFDLLTRIVVKMAGIAGALTCTCWKGGVECEPEPPEGVPWMPRG